MNNDVRTIGVNDSTNMFITTGLSLHLIDCYNHRFNLAIHDIFEEMEEVIK